MAFTDFLPATSRQLNYVRFLAVESGLGMAERDDLVRRVTAGRAASVSALDRRDCGAVIKRLQVEIEQQAKDPDNATSEQRHKIRSLGIETLGMTAQALSVLICRLVGDTRRTGLTREGAAIVLEYLQREVAAKGGVG